MNSVEITRQALKDKPLGWSLYGAIEYRNTVKDEELKQHAQYAIDELLMLHKIEQMNEIAQTEIK